MFSFYLGNEEEKNNDKKDKFGLDFTDITPRGVAVLVNLNLGENNRKSVKNEEELCRHIKLIEKCTHRQLY